MIPNAVKISNGSIATHNVRLLKKKQQQTQCTKNTRGAAGAADALDRRRLRHREDDVGGDARVAVRRRDGDAAEEGGRGGAEAKARV